MLFCRFIFSFYNIVFENLVYNTSTVHEIIFSYILPFFKAIRSDAWPGKLSKLKKIYFLALILCFHYNLLQKHLGH